MAPKKKAVAIDTKSATQKEKTAGARKTAVKKSGVGTKVEAKKAIAGKGTTQGSKHGATIAAEKATTGKSKMTTKSTKKPTAAENTTNQQPKSLSKEQLEHFKKKLMTERQKVLEEMGELQSSNLKQSISDQSGEISRYSYHLGDTASLSYGREFSMGLAERQQKYLEQVDEALQRIADKSYGICKVTGELIPIERLEEVPVAKYSVKGKELLSRQRR